MANRGAIAIVGRYGDSGLEGRTGGREGKAREDKGRSNQISDHPSLACLQRAGRLVRLGVGDDVSV